MRTFQKRGGGFIGLLSLLIAAAISTVLLVMILRGSFGSSQKTLETDKAAIQKAQDVKRLLEKQNRSLTE